MIKLYDASILDGLPYILRQETEVQALAYALKTFMGILKKLFEQAMVYTSEDALTDAICDRLAVEWKVQQYSESYNLEVKRRLIKNALSIYSIAGTKAAVENLVSDIFGNAHVEEWYEYGDDPGYFGVEINGNVPKELEDQFIDTVWAVKPVSAWLRHLRFVHPMPEFIVTFTSAFCVSSQNQLPELSPPWDGIFNEYFTPSRNGTYSTLILPEIGGV